MIKIIENINDLTQTTIAEYRLDVIAMRKDRDVLDCGNGARVWYSVAEHFRLIYKLTGKRRYKRMEDYKNYQLP